MGAQQPVSGGLVSIVEVARELGPLAFELSYRFNVGLLLELTETRESSGFGRFEGGASVLQFDTFLLLANPNASTATATVTFFRDTGAPITRSYTLLPTSRENIWVDLLPGLEANAFSIQVSASAPIVAERAMYWGLGGNWAEAHDTPGVTAPALSWAFAEGVQDSVDASGTFYDSFFLVANPGASALALRAIFMREDGTGVVRDYTVPGSSRFTIDTGTVPELSNQRFAAFLTSTNGVTFVAERAVYWGADFTGGHGSAGTPWTGAIVIPPAPPAPATTSVTPSTLSTAGGTAVTLTGTGYGQDTTVRIGGVAATVTSVMNSTTLRATAPAHPAGLADVSVTSHGATSTLANAFLYVAPPTIASVTPAQGSDSGGTAITIAGANFGATATVRLGGVPASTVVVVNASTITAVTAAHVAGPVDVEVTTNGFAGLKSSGFTYIPSVPTTTAEVTLAFGDSITYGTSSRIEQIGGTNFIAGTVLEGYPSRLQRQLKARYPQQPIAMTNAGVPGECASAPCTSQSGQSRLGGLLSGTQDLVVLLEGVNDVDINSIGGIAAALRQMVQASKAGGRAVVLCTLLPVKPDEVLGLFSHDPTRIKALNEEIRLIAAQEGVVLADLYAAFGGDSVNTSWLSPDGLHPNDAGYDRLTDVLFSVIVDNFELGS
mgnify:CR=1 FL=1